MFIDSFSSLDDLHGADRKNKRAILAALAKAGRFSCFEVDDVLAGPLTWILRESGWVNTVNEKIEKDADGYGTHTRSLYPWTEVTLTEAGKEVLAKYQKAMTLPFTQTGWG